MIDTAIVLCAGFGTRLRPITNYMPKPLVPVWGQPMVAYNLQQLQNYGIKKFILNSHYLAHEIDKFARAYFSAQTDFTVVYEPTILDTGGAVQNVLGMIESEQFFVLNGDIFWQGDDDLLARMAGGHTAGYATLALAQLKNIVGHNQVGDFNWHNQRLVREKSPDSLMFMGCQILEKSFFSDLPLEFSLNIIYDRLLAQMRIRAIECIGRVYHVGTPNILQMLEKEQTDGS